MNYLKSDSTAGAFWPSRREVLAATYAAACGASAIETPPGQEREIGISGADDRLRLIVARNEANGDVAADFLIRLATRHRRHPARVSGCQRSISTGVPMRAIRTKAKAREPLDRRLLRSFGASGGGQLQHGGALALAHSRSSIDKALKHAGFDLSL